MNKKIAFFGASLDVLDIPEKINLKIAYINSLINKIKLKENFLTPYEALISEISPLFKKEEFIEKNKFYIPSEFTPKPTISDFFKVNQKNYTFFMQNDNFKKYAKLLQGFVESSIFPDKSAMIGVDHSLSGGVIFALSKKYGKENLTIIILDTHFDAIPSSIRKNSGGDISSEILPDNIYTCGNFISLLIKEKKILPENLIMIGVSDYPDKKVSKNGKLKKYAEYYLSLEKMGVKFIVKKEVKSNKLDRILSNIKTKYVYVSLDIDVGANNCIYATRFLDRIGISENDLYKIAQKINFYINSKNLELLGFDIMEIDIHFLGLKLKNGIKDRTLGICKNYLKNLLL